MADSFGPFDNANMGEAGWDLIFALLNGVLEESHLVATASGVTARGVDLSPGTALHQGHHYTTDTSREVVSTANTSGSPRIDRCVARVDLTGNTMLPVVLAGTPAPNPQPPNIADTDEPLWRWTVADGAGAVSGLVSERRFVSGLVLFGKSTERPPGKKGRIFYETDTGRVVFWNGSSWVVLYEDTGWVGLSISGHWVATSVPFQVRRVGRVVELHGEVQRGGSFDFLSKDEELIVTLPVVFRPAGLTRYGMASSKAQSDMQVIVSTDGRVLFRNNDTERLPANTVCFPQRTWLVD